MHWHHLWNHNNCLSVLDLIVDIATVSSHLDDVCRISVTFVDKDGEEHHIKVPVGMSMLEAAHENDLELEGKISNPIFSSESVINCLFLSDCCLDGNTCSLLLKSYY